MSDEAPTQDCQQPSPNQPQTEAHAAEIVARPAGSGPCRQLPNEGHKAYQAFLAYRDAGDSRSYTGVAQELKKARQLIARWAAKYEWQERIASWHREIDEARERKIGVKINEMLDRQMSIALALERKCLEALTTIDPKKMTARNLVTMMTFAVALERTSHGITGKLSLAPQANVNLTRPEGDMVSDMVRSLSPVDRDLLRGLSIKFMKVVRLEAEIAAEEGGPPIDVEASETA